MIQSLQVMVLLLLVTKVPRLKRDAGFKDATLFMVMQSSLMLMETKYGKRPMETIQEESTNFMTLKKVMIFSSTPSAGALLPHTLRMVLLITGMSCPVAQASRAAANLAQQLKWNAEKTLEESGDLSQLLLTWRVRESGVEWTTSSLRKKSLIRLASTYLLTQMEAM